MNGTCEFVATALANLLFEPDRCVCTARKALPHPRKPAKWLRK